MMVTIQYFESFALWYWFLNSYGQHRRAKLAFVKTFRACSQKSIMKWHEIAQHAPSVLLAWSSPYWRKQHSFRYWNRKQQHAKHVPKQSVKNGVRTTFSPHRTRPKKPTRLHQTTQTRNRRNIQRYLHNVYFLVFIPVYCFIICYCFWNILNRNTTNNIKIWSYQLHHDAS